MRDTTDGKRAIRQTHTEAIDQLVDFFVNEIQCIYWTEKQLIRTLFKMQQAATSEQLQKIFEIHFEETREHVTRLERVLYLLNEKVLAKKSHAMAGLVEEANRSIEDSKPGTTTRDVTLMLSIQKMEHYEIATYSTLAQVAENLELGEIRKILLQTLQEEKEASERFNYIAQNKISYRMQILP